ncbi:MAG: response regulator transcription factor [Actinomycetota bacterium]|nr:response regulator transcription factor [Actinomycetota bacterium]
MADGEHNSTHGVVLLIDDDVDIRRVVRDRLRAAGFTVAEAESGERGLEVLASQPVDIVVLDVGLPGIDGFSVLRAIRASSQVAVVLLTAAGDEADRVLGLEIGADDYVVKPFSPRELVARVRAVARRAQPNLLRSVLQFGDMVVDTRAREVRRNGELVSLTAREFDLLAFLGSAPRQTFTREQLLHHVWNSEPGWQDVATVTEHIHRLRRRIEADHSAPRHLITVRGSGYRFDP